MQFPGISSDDDIVASLNNHSPQVADAINVQQQLLFRLKKSLVNEVMAPNSGKRICELTLTKLLHQFWV